MTLRELPLLILIPGAILASTPVTADLDDSPRAERSAERRGSLPPSARTRPPRGGATQRNVSSARDAVLPALVHVEPIVEVYRRGQKAKAAVTGSGVIVSPEGHVLTNDHVVQNARRVTCTLSDKREFPARVVGHDSFTDVAVLQLELDGDTVPHARLGTSADLSAGRFVIALGSPLGLARSLSLGVVSTPDRYFPEDFLPDGEVTGTYNTWIQTDAAINPGNSGGPLVDLAGRVVGINARAVAIFGENIGFAIPIDVVRDVAEQLILHGEVRRSWIGVRWQHLESLAEYFGSEDKGVLVGGIVAGSPADRAGMQPGDVLVEWNGKAVSVRFEEELPAFRKSIADTPPGSDVTVKLLRRGARVTLRMQTEQRPSQRTTEAELSDWGLTAKDITPEIARQRRLPDLIGAYVTGVKAAAPAAISGLRQGDVIREVEGESVASTADLQRLVTRLMEEGVRQVLVRANRGATRRVAVVEPNLSE